MRRLPAVALVALLIGATSARAQTVPAPVPNFNPAFLPRTDVSFLWGTFATPDTRFAYDGRIVADMDVANYGAGRFNMLIDYEAVISHERRYFDLNHGNYVLEGSGSFHIGAVEIAGVFHHASRHLVDRQNSPAISWNVTSVRALRSFAFKGSTLDTAIDLGKVTQPAFVDYRWTSNVRLEFRHPVDPHAALYGIVNGGLIGVNRAKLGRDRQCGARFEGGVRVMGKAASLEIFAAYERRIDAFPTDRFRVRFTEVGFRITSR